MMRKLFSINTITIRFKVAFQSLLTGSTRGTKVVISNVPPEYSQSLHMMMGLCLLYRVISG